MEAVLINSNEILFSESDTKVKKNPFHSTRFSISFTQNIILIVLVPSFFFQYAKTSMVTICYLGVIHSKKSRLTHF